MHRFDREDGGGFRIHYWACALGLISARRRYRNAIQQKYQQSKQQ